MGGPVTRLVAEITREVSRATGTDIRNLPPLYDSVDPERVSDLFLTTSDMIDIRFTYAGHVVRVTDIGEVEVQEHLQKR